MQAIRESRAAEEFAGNYLTIAEYEAVLVERGWIDCLKGGMPRQCL
jgi:hypothetical protein